MEENKVRLNIVVPEELRKMVKISAAESGTTIANYVVEAIMEKIKREKENAKI